MFKLFSDLPSWFYRVAISVFLALGIAVNVYGIIQLESSQYVSSEPTISSMPLDAEIVPTNLSSESTSAPIPPSSEISSLQVQGDSQYGHLPYSEANFEVLMIVSSYGQHEYQRFERLMPDAAFALMKMIYAARDESVWIVPASAFRDYSTQKKLFNRQVQKKGSAKEAARSSAPPGYSEHHTGYAVDLVDGSVPDADINDGFAQTQAYQWLVQHAQEYGFELSFPENNTQGIKFEPWHWRFIDSPDAKRIFGLSD